MNIWIPLMMVIKGDTNEIAGSMSAISIHLLLTVYSISHLTFLLGLPPLAGEASGGRGMLLFVVFITEMNDVFQYTWGKLFGKFKIAPKVSPNKTWEGFIGGVISSTIVGYYLRFLTPFTEMEALATSFALACVGFVGDLVISAVKRDMGLKDMSDAIPGHGGILDRIDSLAMTAPVFFHIVYMLYYRC
jgi:phosphatidate cytidylyltransferase